MPALPDSPAPGPARPSDLVTLVSLSALWGASFLFIKWGVDDLSPLAVVEARLLLGALFVFLCALLLRRRRGMLAALRRPLVLPAALVSSAVPYLCFAWGETRVATGIAAIANAAAPLFGALIAHVWPQRRGGERLDGRRILGIGLGLGGVLVLVGVDGLRGEVDLAGLLVLFAAPVCYGLGALLAREAFAGDDPVVPATVSNAVAAVCVLPFALALGRPDHAPGLRAVLAVAALGVGGTGLAYLLFYRLLARLGGPRTLTVTYLLPFFALVYGALFLGEALRWTAAVALAAILLGVTVTNGIGGRRRAVAPTARGAEAEDTEKAEERLAAAG